MLPVFNFSTNITVFGVPESGEVSYSYGPFLNLINPNTSEHQIPLIPLRIKSSEAGINITKPITLEAESSYDDSVNLIITDGKNPQKIVNSRFYLTDSLHYKVADRKGNVDSNIYSKENFKTKANLIQTVENVVKLDFLGISDGGYMKVGSYTFYFKLSDADGNETDFVSESGKVVCHIGTTNDPKSIRGGLQDEISNKAIKFKLRNLDPAYDYVNIYYTRTTGTESEEVTKAYKVMDKVKINGEPEVTMLITGYEVHEPISEDEINTRLVNFESSKTLANCQNITFLGNTSNNYELFKSLERLSLLITPEVVYSQDGIGNLQDNYTERSSNSDNGLEYYNSKNIYYRLGYWDDEIYRFGIVYILDNTLSPVFNIRGIKELSENTVFTNFNASSDIKIGEDYSIINSNPNNPENAKGVFKITTSHNQQFNAVDSIKPIGIKFNFTGNVITGYGEYIEGLKTLTKGFFIVRQKRIPTILSQGIGISTSKLTGLPLFKGTIGSDHYAFTNRPIMQSFIKYPTSSTGNFKMYDKVLGMSLIGVDKTVSNALLCPEASLRPHIFENIFNGSEFVLKSTKFTTLSSSYGGNSALSYSGTKFYQGSVDINTDSLQTLIARVLLVKPGVDLVTLDSYKFSTKAGDPVIAHTFKDPINGDYQDASLNESNYEDGAFKIDTPVRGEFNSFVGLNNDNVKDFYYYNIMEKGYNFEQNWRNYFLARYNNSSPYFAASDRYHWGEFNNLANASLEVFRGDCYINTYTHRMNWNFIDPELPTNTSIVDKYTWTKNMRIVKKTSLYLDGKGKHKQTSEQFAKLLEMFTYKDAFIPEWQGHTAESEQTNHGGGSDIIEPDNKKFKKYSEANGTFGALKVNRPDLNAVNLGLWITFKICSNVNLAMRDINFSRPDEEAVHKAKRSFYPYQEIDISNRLPESDVLNSGISKTLGDRMYFEIPDVPFIKTNFSTRINYSNILRKGVFDNGNRVFEAGNFVDYSREYGALVKLVEWSGKLIAVMEHGILLIPVNERAMVTNASGENVSINTSKVLPENPMVISNMFGSVWPESVIKTSRYVYGIDTVAKKIWRTNGTSIEIISDIKIQKYLNDNITIKEIENDRTIGRNFIKTHYDAGKYDVIFSFKYGNKGWVLCWNELTNKWVTQYTWFPEFSENINNIFCTFANQEKHPESFGKLYYHRVLEGFGEAGNSELLPTHWYGNQHPFEFEFVVAAVPGVQKIFNNLKIISNLAEPYSFYYEVVGEGYDFNTQKNTINLLNDISVRYVDGVDMVGLYNVPKNEDIVKSRYRRYLSQKQNIKKLPYIYTQSYDVNDPNSFFRDRGELSPSFTMAVLKDMNLRKHNKTNEILITSYQKGADLKKYGRLKGNMQYLEDSWDVQIQPFSFKYAYVTRVSSPEDPIYGDPTYGGPEPDGFPELPPSENQWSLKFTDFKSMDIRDKYIKIRVKYKGDQLVVINALRTLYTISYA